MSGKILIHGKEYQTVAYRVSEFRKTYTLEKGWAITTQCVEHNERKVIFKCEIKKDGVVLASGHAEENRNSSHINRTSAFENAETSSIGRALASAGMGGREFCSANEVSRAIYQQQEKNKEKQIEKTEDWINEKVTFKKAKGLTWKELAIDKEQIIIKKNGSLTTCPSSEYLKLLENWDKATQDVKTKAAVAYNMFADFRRKEAGK